VDAYREGRQRTKDESYVSDSRFAAKGKKKKKMRMYVLFRQHLRERKKRNVSAPYKPPPARRKGAIGRPDWLIYSTISQSPAKLGEKNKEENCTHTKNSVHSIIRAGSPWRRMKGGSGPFENPQLGAD